MCLKFNESYMRDFIKGKLVILLNNNPIIEVIIIIYVIDNIFMNKLFVLRGTNCRSS